MNAWQRRTTGIRATILLILTIILALTPVAVAFGHAVSVPAGR